MKKQVIRATARPVRAKPYTIMAYVTDVPAKPYTIHTHVTRSNRGKVKHR
jgi:hypothetical protein